MCLKRKKCEKKMKKKFEWYIFCEIIFLMNLMLILGVWMLDGWVIDYFEVFVIVFNYIYVDVYSVFWGLNDDGKIVEGFGFLVMKVFEKGIIEVSIYYFI